MLSYLYFNQFFSFFFAIKLASHKYIKSSSPLSKYWDTPDEERDKSLLNDLRATEQRYTEFPTRLSPTGKIEITMLIFLILNLKRHMKILKF